MTPEKLTAEEYRILCSIRRRPWRETRFNSNPIIFKRLKTRGLIERFEVNDGSIFYGITESGNTALERRKEQGKTSSLTRLERVMSATKRLDHDEKRALIDYLLSQIEEDKEAKA